MTLSSEHFYYYYYYFFCSSNALCTVCRALCGQPLPLYYRHDSDLFHPELCTRIINDFIRGCRATPNPLGKNLLSLAFYLIGSFLLLTLVVV